MSQAWWRDVDYELFARVSRERNEALVALDAHRAALRDLVRVVSNQLARGENEPGDFEAAWRRAVELTKEKP